MFSQPPKLAFNTVFPTLPSPVSSLQSSSQQFHGTAQRSTTRDSTPLSRRGGIRSSSPDAIHCMIAVNNIFGICYQMELPPPPWPPRYCIQIAICRPCSSRHLLSTIFTAVHSSTILCRVPSSRTTPGYST